MLKQAAKNVVDPLLARVWKLGPLRRSGESFDLIEVATLLAAVDSANYYVQHMQGAKVFGADLELLSFAAQTATPEGLILEFGVASGRTITHIANTTKCEVHGFDTFSGLPEDWRPGFEAGHFAQVIPQTPPNVTLHRGLFSETLPGFLEKHKGPVSLLHVDCDLYSSTCDIFFGLAERLVPGSVIVFDEYFNYPGWRDHEYKAFCEFLERSGLSYRYIGLVPAAQQVAVVLV